MMTELKYRVAVDIVSNDGRSGGKGVVEFVQLSLGRRMLGALKRLAIGTGGGLLLLPVPAVHLFGVLFFLVFAGLATKGLVAAQVLDGAFGSCPSCGSTGDLFVGLGGRRAAFPVMTACPGCHVTLELSVGGASTPVHGWR